MIMRLLEHHCDGIGDLGGVAWWARCACGFETGFDEDRREVVDAFVAHIVAVLVVERPPDDVIENARRAFEQRQRR